MNSRQRPHGGSHVQPAIIASPYRDDLGDAIFTGRHHGGDRRVFGTESGARPGVDAHARITVAGVGHERRTDVAEKSIVHRVGIEHGFGRSDQFVVGHRRHLLGATDPMLQA
jgi:hypothetical protein